LSADSRKRPAASRDRACRRAEWHHNWSPVKAFLSEDDLKAGQDEMALNRKSTKTRAEREFLKLPEANFIFSITVRNGITTLSA